MFKGGALYLYATVDVEDKPLNESPTGWLKVDLGIVIDRLGVGTSFSIS